MTVRPDNRLLDEPMRAVRCLQCAAQVEVRKSSWQQTSIQWHDEAVDACQERRTAKPLPGPNGDFFETCDALNESIRQAALGGALHVQDDQY